MFSLDDLLDYECRASERYRRALSIVVAGGHGGEGSFLLRAGDLVRGSDKVIGLDGTVAIVMGETPIEGVLCAFERFATRYGNDTALQCGAASFPQDAHDAKNLQHIALRRYEAAKTQGGNALVWRD
jgi:hypothetical protein